MTVRFPSAREQRAGLTAHPAQRSAWRGSSWREEEARVTRMVTRAESPRDLPDLPTEPAEGYRVSYSEILAGMSRNGGWTHKQIRDWGETPGVRGWVTRIAGPKPKRWSEYIAATRLAMRNVKVRRFPEKP
jgi:hypothetical protein